MVKKASHKVAKKTNHVKNVSADSISSTKHPHHTHTVEEYKKELLSSESVYDKMFEHKLSAQYKEFRNLKERKEQSKKFVGVLIAIFVIILVAILLISFS